jgi:hypothetical protein
MLVTKHAPKCVARWPQELKWSDHSRCGAYWQICGCRGYELLAGEQEELKYVILELTPVSSIDTTGCHALVTIFSEYK